MMNERNEDIELAEINVDGRGDVMPVIRRPNDAQQRHLLSTVSFLV